MNFRCIRSLHEKQRHHLEVRTDVGLRVSILVCFIILINDDQDLSLKACISLHCSKVSILFLEKDRHWLVQLAYAVLHKTQSRPVLSNQGDEINVYEGYKNNGIAQLAISSGECVVIPNVNTHAGYDSSMDALAGIVGRNCLAAPIMAGDSKSNTRCVGVIFATNKARGSFLGDVPLAPILTVLLNRHFLSRCHCTEYSSTSCLVLTTIVRP